MRNALGVHVSTYEVTASLVDCDLPELGPIATRTVPVTAAPGGIGGAVEVALGFMRVQARQNDIDIAGSAVVCENALQREIVADALAQVEVNPPLVVDIFDARLSDRFSPDISAALLVADGATAPAAARSRAGSSRDDRRGMWPVAAVGACVLAALGGVTAWAMTSETPSETSAPVEVVYPTAATAVPTGTTAPSPTPVLPGPSAPPSTTDAVSETVEVVVPVPVPVVVLPSAVAPVETVAPQPVRPTRTVVPTTPRATPTAVPDDDDDGSTAPTTTPSPATSTTTTTATSEPPT